MTKIFNYKDNQPVVWFNRSLERSNQYCLYCGNYIGVNSGVESNKEHLIAREFVPNEYFSSTDFNFLFRCCVSCNNRKSNIERHLSTSTLFNSDARKADESINKLALKKANNDYQQLAQQVLHADETPVVVIADDNQKSYMWVYCSGGDSPDPNSTLKNIVIYDYQPSRAAACPKEYLKGYAGYLQVDGYAAYESIGATLAGCMAHVRRKFVEAQKVQVKGKVGRADWAVAHIQKLYRIEAQLVGKTAEEKYTLRQQYAVPLLDEFKVWLDKSAQQIPPKTALGMAVAYTLRQWEKLITYTQHGQLSIDNNRAERAIKPFVIGRKNWLFSNTASGAKASAILYSVIETAKANGLNPVKYVELLLTEIPKRDSGDYLENLMPWMVKLGVHD
ncbi:IS66 family transposase [Cellvibrio sp. OA-2007]|uniref:IS66 family transposase n=1 Tax=Cellvibrio sp. OA-2007 TaxID=529823 RepID=UPI000785C22A|nr:IS66 family transposase [Cellvibrio sp. OA-2007]